MKRMLAFMVMALAVSGWGCSGQSGQNGDAAKVGPAPGSSATGIQYDQPLTLDDVRLAFQHAGLTLADRQDIEPDNYAINSVIPAVYSISGSGQVICVYVYNDIAERIQVVQHHRLSKYVPPSFFPVPEGYLARTYSTRNVLLVDVLEIGGQNDIPPGENQVWKAIDAIVNSLDDIQQMNFAARSQNWDAEYLIEYYQHWYKDAAGVTHVDRYNTGKWSVLYTGANPESIQNIRYTYKTPGRSGSGDGIFDKEGNDYYLRIGQSGSSSYPVADGVYTLTITWDREEETLNLKPTQ